MYHCRLNVDFGNNNKGYFEAPKSNLSHKHKAKKLLICLLLLFHASTSCQARLFGYLYQSFVVVVVSWRNGSSGLAICIMFCCCFRNGSSGSAICAFTVQSVKDRFADRVYKYRETLTSVYSPLPAEKIPADSSPGKVSGCL